MILEIWTENLTGNWVWGYDNYLGGTPEFIINTAECASNIFDEVYVYYDGSPGENNGVYYLPRRDYVGRDVLLSCNDVPHNMAEYNIYWSNWHNNKQDHYMNFDERIVLSNYHKSIFGKDSRIVPHSCWPKSFNGSNKIRKQCLYSSSPDRGAEFLKSIWGNVNKQTGAELICTYDQNISEDKMIEYYNSSQFWLHPCQGVELFCIAAVKAQVAKCIPIVVPNMALDETVKYGVKTTLDNYEVDLINAINNLPEVKDVDFGDWDSVTRELFTNVC